MKTTILIPTKNEINGMREIMPEIKKEWYDQILVVDAGSSDGTIEYVKENGWDLVIQKGPGVRAAYIESYDHIKGDIVITFSPDGNSKVEAIPALISKMKENYDMVIASRYLNGAKSYDDTPMTGLANHIFSKMVGVFGYKYTDAGVMLRSYKKELPQKLGLLNIRGKYYERYIGPYVSWEPLMSMRAAKSRMKIGEITMDEPKRIGDSDKTYIFTPGTRIYHFRAGFSCIYIYFEELFRWRF